MVCFRTNRFHQFEHKENEDGDADDSQEKRNTTDKHENFIEEIVARGFKLAVFSLVIERVPLLFNSLLWGLSRIRHCLSIFINLLDLFGFLLCHQNIISGAIVNLLLISMVNSNFELDVSESCKFSRASKFVKDWLVACIATSCEDPTVCVLLHVFLKFNK